MAKATGTERRNQQVATASNTGGKTTNHRLGFTGRISAAAARHPWRTLGLWVVPAVAAYLVAGTMNLVPNPDTAGTEATKAADLIDQRLREQTPPEEFLVVETQAATADEDAYSAFVDSLRQRLASD